MKKIYLSDEEWDSVMNEYDNATKSPAGDKSGIIKKYHRAIEIIIRAANGHGDIKHGSNA